MPIPKPNKNEDKQKFVSDCMSDPVMKKEHTDTKQRVAICLSQTKKKGESSLIEEVHDNLFISGCVWDDEWDEFTYDVEASEVYDENDNMIMAAEKNGKKVTLNKPFRTPDGPKKFAVYVKNDKGKVVIVRFGDPNMTIKKDNPERRKSFRARMRCDSPGPKWKARYWACKAW
ncbi:hypothetical protein EBZ38_13935 [bacterium]|nr:hypothetical protein [bacterium]NDC95656.1 hypothetical protein [bacterium]NDD85358.1 hypothetical protein [bacterium]